MPRNVPLAVALTEDGRPKYIVAAAAGINPNTLSAIIHGHRDASPEVRARLAAELGRPEHELFENAETADV